jgi:hypothetical protein
MATKRSGAAALRAAGKRQEAARRRATKEARRTAVKSERARASSRLTERSQNARQSEYYKRDFHAAVRRGEPWALEMALEDARRETEWTTRLPGPSRRELAAALAPRHRVKSHVRKGVRVRAYTRRFPRS